MIYHILYILCRLSLILEKIRRLSKKYPMSEFHGAKTLHISTETTFVSTFPLRPSLDYGASALSLYSQGKDKKGFEYSLKVP